MLQLFTLAMVLSLFSLTGCTNSNSHIKDELIGGNPGAEPEPTTDPNEPDPTPSFTATPVPSFTFTAIPTATPTNTFTPIPTNTFTPTPTNTFTPTPTYTFTPTPTYTFTPTPTNTFTPTPTNTFTPTPTYTFTPTPTYTFTPTPTYTFTPTPTYTFTPTPTYTFTPTPTVTPTNTPTPIPPDCDFDNYQELVPKACIGHTMTVCDEIVAKAVISNTKVAITATKKNGGAGGSRFYDAKASFESMTSVLLPSVINIVPGGNAGNGQKLYLYFDNDVICSYRSHAGNKYQTPVCKLGGQINPSKIDGFATGIGSYIADVSRVDDILSVQVHVNGSSGGGVVTTVKFDLIFD